MFRNNGHIVGWHLQGWKQGVSNRKNFCIYRFSLHERYLTLRIRKSRNSVHLKTKLIWSFLYSERFRSYQNYFESHKGFPYDQKFIFQEKEKNIGCIKWNCNLLLCFEKDANMCILIYLFFFIHLLWTTFTNSVCTVGQKSMIQKQTDTKNK